jgi:hypothetical protein
VPDPPPLTPYDRQLARTAEYSRKRTAAGAEIGILPSVVNSRRKKKASKDLGYFLRTYFPAAFNLKFSPAHKEVIKLVQQAVLDGGLFAVAKSRQRLRKDALDHPRRPARFGQSTAAA